MKHLLLATTASLLLIACATNDTSSSVMSDTSEKMMTDDTVIESDNMVADDAMMESETVMESKPEPMITEAPATPAASVDCTGLSDDECMSKIMSFGSEAAPAEAMPVEPVETEIMQEIPVMEPENN